MAAPRARIDKERASIGKERTGFEGQRMYGRHAMTRRRQRGIHRAGFAVLALNALCTVAAARDYQPPPGFNGHQWGETLSTYQGLTLWRANTAINSNGKMAEVNKVCRPEQPCIFEQRVEGDGSYGLGEYYFDKDVNPWVEQRIELFTISYLFCARWSGEYLPNPLNKRMRLCGARVMFRSDTAKQLAALGEHYRSNFDKVLARLIAEFGEPPGYERSPTITIETDTQRIGPAAAVPTSGYVRYRWCGLDTDEKQLRPSCPATVTLVFDAERGEGTILYAAAPLYDYAYARRDTGDAHDEIFALLNGERLDQHKYYVKRECTIGRICGPSKQGMSKKDFLAFQP
jgi:hypothetical protein